MVEKKEVKVLEIANDLAYALERYLEDEQGSHCHHCDRDTNVGRLFHRPGCMRDFAEGVMKRWRDNARIEVTVKRRLLEMAYLYAWGVEGSSERRDEWRNLARLFNVGCLVYHGHDEFSWE